MFYEFLSCKNDKLIVLHCAGPLGSATLKKKTPKKPNKTHPRNLKNMIKKWKFCFQLQPFSTEYKVSGDDGKKKKKETIKPIPQSRSTGIQSLPPQVQ